MLPDYWAVCTYNPDYGVDLDIELFDKNNNIALGEHVLFQVKSTEKIEIVRKRISPNEELKQEYIDRGFPKYFEYDVVKYEIDTDLLATVEKMGLAIPVMLCIVDLEKEDAYIVCLNDYIDKLLVNKKPDYFNQGSITIYIPVLNNFKTENAINLIEFYGKRAKYCSLFNQINIHYNELKYHTTDVVKYSKNFFSYILRLDILPCISPLKQDLELFCESEKIRKSGRITWEMLYHWDEMDTNKKDLRSFADNIIDGEDSSFISELYNLWEDLNTIVNTYESCKLDFLPTYEHGIIIKY